MILVRYEQASGVISGLWEAANQAILELQIRPDDPTYGYLLVEDETLSATELQEQWLVVNGELVAKTELTIQAAPNPFTADGTSLCQITVVPFVPCTLRMNQEVYDLTAEDSVIEVSAAQPLVCLVSLEPMRTHWAQPITVEAR